MTTQNNEVEKIKIKIRNLLARNVENGATEAEMFAAMGKVSDLLTQFNMTLTDVIAGSETFVTEVINTGSKHANIQVNTIVRLAEMFDCKCYQTKTTEGINLTVFGFETDVAMAVYLSNMFKTVFNIEVKKFKESDYYVNYIPHRRKLYADFLRGFGNKLNARMRQLKAENDATIKHQMAKTDNALVLVNKMGVVEEEFTKNGIKLKTLYKNKKKSANMAAYNAGQQSGDGVNLSRPISGNTSFGGYLK